MTTGATFRVAPVFASTLSAVASGREPAAGRRAALPHGRWWRDRALRRRAATRPCCWSGWASGWCWI